MNHEPYDTLAATYAVGALDGQERVDFERHLAAGCDVCEATLRGFRRLTARSPARLPTVAASSRSAP